MPTALALTLGEPAGIGPDLTLAAWTLRAQNGCPPFFAVGDPALLEDRARRLGLRVPICAVAPQDAIGAFDAALPVVAAGPRATAKPGMPDATSAAAVVQSLDRAVDLVMSGAARALVTAPLAKSVVYAAGFPFPGHTEYLAARCAAPDGTIPHPVMMIWSPLLAVVPATIHIPLAQVPAHVTHDLLVQTGRIVDRDMRMRFGIAAPRLAFAGLNPHAGEDGTLGREDEDVVRPAIAALRSEGIDASGPRPADTLFHEEARTGYDVVIGMYHDQVLIPAKTLAFHDGVNVTLGLPFVRTSPDHGTAFDLAGTGRANPTSLQAALRLAWRLTEPGRAA
ncbi:MAG: 4-hydroxythreonine-4-phosphate dehydrogenase PdxA [Rhizobiales bacterium 24-66-13]|jgi:4-hydroxythreonine-4-phosphate dehydrogenase|nr:MAG: 4-hydroxythreonine-4-phosphate dehydrogenase PdxA [Rhizobiales bacterium 24-66-13]OZB02708.1 MAG: 4-hydroxythreonine-4-phosphate dehydrogenase PdxA [Rhizobiales bacterium 39-66-18]HQS07972.1 4-hydroxythreonine-4-phosphate dehydrogenase PdxA [Xanthobacteraceae bacterium]HQS47916.1 4-hydroxythreonine-4-phosphate dehydrogenase PdxA [Xanthobacteraceae bacterium]